MKMIMAKKILLVEDDNNLREIYEARLQAEGYEIVSARDGEEALVIAKSEKPDLVISDIMMPKISGFEMLDILRNTEGLKHVRVIMLTALGQSDDQQRADKLGADRYLVKSQVTLEDIVKAAHDLLDDGAAPDNVAAAAAQPPQPATPATPTTSVPVATPPPAAQPDNVTKDDKLMENAIDSLVAGTKTPAPTPTPTPAAPDASDALMRALWTQDPVTFPTKFIPAEITDMTMTPLPVAPIPLWIGGSSDAALERTIRIADGWHGSRETPEQTASIVQRLRAERPGPDFTVSTRLNWDGRDLGELRARIAAYEAAGVQHVMVASDLLRSAEIDNWDAILDGVGRLVA